VVRLAYHSGSRTASVTGAANSIADICSTFKISRATLYRYIARYKAAHRE
jgi:hypothetical protein